MCESFVAVPAECCSRECQQKKDADATQRPRPDSWLFLGRSQFPSIRMASTQWPRALIVALMLSVTFCNAILRPRTDSLSSVDPGSVSGYLSERPGEEVASEEVVSDQDTCTVGVPIPQVALIELRGQTAECWLRLLKWGALVLNGTAASPSPFCGTCNHRGERQDSASLTSTLVSLHMCLQI